MFWKHLMAAPTELDTPEAVRGWLAQNDVRARVDERSSDSVAVTTVEGQSTVFHMPVAVSHLCWVLKGQP
jgi:hypothetical protein